MIYSTPEVKIEMMETEDIILTSLGENETDKRPVYSLTAEGTDSSNVLGLR